MRMQVNHCDRRQQYKVAEVAATIFRQEKAQREAGDAIVF